MSSEVRTYGDPDTRVRILDATWALLERGDRITMASAATSADVSRQAVYLHFGDRSGLLVALVDHIDVSLGRDEIRAHIHDETATGLERLRRWVDTMGWYTEKIDRVTMVLEAGANHDEALAAAWRDRMDGRRGHIRRILSSVQLDGALREGWSLEDAVNLVFVVTMPGPWRELTGAAGWSAEEYGEWIWSLLASGLVEA